MGISLPAIVRAATGLVLAAFAWSPQIARAASCSPIANGTSALTIQVASGTQLCQGGDAGIWYRANGSLTVNLNNEPITLNGISLTDDGSGRPLALNVGLQGTYGAAPVTSTAASIPAISLSSSGGSIAITTLAGGTVTAQGQSATGILATTSGQGTIAITTNAPVISAGNGIVASMLGSGAINITTNAPIKAGDRGILVSSAGLAGSNVFVTVNSDIDAAAFAIDMRISTPDPPRGLGRLVVEAGSASNPVTLISRSDSAIQVANSGSMVIDVFGNVIGGVSASGTLFGPASINLMGTITTASVPAIVALTTEDADASVSAGSQSAPAQISAPSALNAIIASSFAGAAQVTVFGNVTGGILASSRALDIARIAFSGSITADNTALFASGAGRLVEISVGSAGAPSQIVTTSPDVPAIEADGTTTKIPFFAPNGSVVSIVAFANVTGRIEASGAQTTVDFGGNLSSASGTGITASGTDQTTIRIESGSAVTAPGQIAVLGQSVSNLLIDNGGTATGEGTTAHPVIVYGSAATTIVNESGAAVRGTAGLPTDLAIAGSADIAPGTVNFDNAGTIVGRVDFTQSSNAAFSNSGLWLTSGTSSFATDSSTLVNQQAGRIVASGTTTFAGAPSFSNDAVLDLHGSNPSPGDTLIAPGSYVGSAGSKFIADAALGTVGSGPACGAIADCLQVGSASGATGIVVNDTLPASSAGLNPQGILLATGPGTATSFFLDPSSPGFDPSTDSIDEGAFSYSLAGSGDQVRLLGAPNSAIIAIPETVSAVQNIGYETSPWLDRQADLRDQLGSDGTGVVTPGLWFKGVANFLHRDAAISLTTPGSPVLNFDSRYAQSTYALVAGGDSGGQSSLMSGDTLLFGVMAGYVNSGIDFVSTPNRANISGALVGVYSTWLYDGLFADIAIKGDFLGTRLQRGSVVTATPGTTQAGAEMEVGKRIFLSQQFFVEPSADLSAFRTWFDDFRLAGITIRSSENKSVRGALGLRVGTTALSTADETVDLSFIGRAWNEFEGGNAVQVAAGGGPLVVKDSIGGAFGEIEGRADVSSLDSPLSCFFGADTKFRSNFVSETLTAGLRYHW